MRIELRQTHQRISDRRHRRDHETFTRQRIDHGRPGEGVVLNDENTQYRGTAIARFAHDTSTVTTA
jgi:hypothetical protein